MSLEGSYITVEEADTIIESLVASTDPRSDAWWDLDEADKAIMLRHAARDIDAVRWAGVRRTREQALAWPRVDPGECIAADGDYSGRTALGGSIDADGLPYDLRHAAALQAAHEASQHAGTAPALHVDEAARRGVMSHSGAGHAETLDLRVANSAWAMLCRDAQQLLTRYRLAGGGIA